MELTSCEPGTGWPWESKDKKDMVLILEEHVVGCVCCSRGMFWLLCAEEGRLQGSHHRGGVSEENL